MATADKLPGTLADLIDRAERSRLMTESLIAHLAEVLERSWQLHRDRTGKPERRSKANRRHKKAG